MRITLSFACVIVSISVANAEPNLEKARDGIVEGTNKFRKKHEREPLKVDPKLSKTAQDFAEFMARTDKYGHEADGRTFLERIKEQKYDYCTAMENIAWQFDPKALSGEELASKFVQMWIDSKGHRENMLNPAGTEIGVGLARSNESDRFYAVQVFARPKSQTINFKITNKAKDAVKYQVDGREFELKPRYSITHPVCQQVKLVFLNGDGMAAKELAPKDGDAYVVTAISEGVPEVRAAR